MCDVLEAYYAIEPERAHEERGQKATRVVVGAMTGVGTLVAASLEQTALWWR